LAGKILFGGGLGPKGAMAYAVTYGIGKALERLYQTRAPYTKAERRRIYEQAYERGRRISRAAAPQG
jgi:hypothetical protein